MKKINRNGFTIREVEGRSLMKGEWKKHPTITVSELSRLRKMIEPAIDNSEKSILNKELTKKQALKILFAPIGEKGSTLHYMAYNNILKEFIYKDKNFKLEVI